MVINFGTLNTQASTFINIKVKSAFSSDEKIQVWTVTYRRPTETQYTLDNNFSAELSKINQSNILHKFKCCSETEVLYFSGKHQGPQGG
jgi:hypothetical protein